MLVTVLVVTAIGLLFGAGSLLLFRYQCQVRIDRQHELEKVYAVRSALNYTRTHTGINPNGNAFAYYTNSERQLGLFVKPVAAIFPNATNENHFAMTRKGQFSVESRAHGWYDSLHDYECGWIGTTNLQMRSLYGGDGKYGLGFSDVEATKNVKWWVNIGMLGTGGWLQDDYGRRYCFLLRDYVGRGRTGQSGDIVRLCIIRNSTNEAESANSGRRHGWPLSAGERGLVFEV